MQIKLFNFLMIFIINFSLINNYCSCSTKTEQLTSEKTHLITEPILKNENCKSRCCSCISSIWNEFTNNSDILSAIAIFIIDLIFFLGMWFPDLIPSIVTSSAYTSLSFIGLLCFPFMFMAIYKKLLDIYYTIKYKNCPLATWNIFNFGVQFEGIISTISYFVAGMFLIFKNKIVPKTIFKIYMPIGIISIFVNILKDLLNFIFDKSIAKRLLKINSNNDIDKIKTIYNIYLNKSSIDCNKKMVRLALSTRSNMDPATWIKLNKILKKRSIESVLIDENDENDENDEYQFLIQNLITNIKIQRNMSLLNLIGNLLGDIEMGIFKIYPYTKIQAILTLITAFLYDVRLIIQKSLQCVQRCKM